MQFLLDTLPLPYIFKTICIALFPRKKYNCCFTKLKKAKLVKVNLKATKNNKTINAEIFGIIEGSLYYIHFLLKLVFFNLK